MKQTKCFHCGKTFVCDNGMWFTTCDCALRSIMDKPELFDLSKAGEHDILLGKRVELVFPISSQRWTGTIYQREDHNRYSWKSDDGQLGCMLIFEHGFWRPFLWINLKAMEKVNLS